MVLAQEAVIQFGELTSHFAEPKLALAAGVVAVAGAFGEGVKTYLEHRSTQNPDGSPQPGLADPFLAKAGRVRNTLTKVAERTGYYAGIIAVSFGLAQAAGPYTMHAKEEGVSTFIIDGSYASDAPDMQTANGSQESRLAASVDASLAAANANRAPVSLIVEGSTADTILVSSQHTEQVPQKIDSVLTATFRNGESMAQAVKDALPLGGGRPNTIIFMTPALSPEDAGSIQQTMRNLKKNYPQDNIEGVVIGRGNVNEQIGAATIDSAVDEQSIVDAVGAKHVRVATTEPQLEQQLNQIVSKTQGTENKQNSYTYLYLAGLSSLVMAGSAIARRLSGTIRLLTNS